LSYVNCGKRTDGTLQEGISRTTFILFSCPWRKASLYHSDHRYKSFVLDTASLILLRQTNYSVILLFLSGVLYLTFLSRRGLDLLFFLPPFQFKNSTNLSINCRGLLVAVSINRPAVWRLFRKARHVLKMVLLGIVKQQPSTK